MAEGVLYLFKAARRPAYRQENLRLVAAERGSIVEVAYNRMWVAPELLAPGAIAAGTIADIVVTDRPFSLFVPVRQAEIPEATSDDLTLRLRLLLRSWVAVEGGDAAGFTAAVKAAAPGRVPGDKFVAPKRDTTRLVACYDGREDAGWRAVVDGLLAVSRACPDEPYKESVFFRPLAVRAAGELHPARTVPLPPGERAELRLEFYNPHLSAGDVAPLSLRALAPEDALRVRAPERFPATGEAAIEVEALASGGTLALQVGPAPALHTSLSLRFGAPAAPREGRPAPGGVPEARVKAACDVVLRAARLDPAAERAVLDAFHAALPGDAAIAERRAVALAAVGEEAAAFAALRPLDPERLGDDARFLRFRLTLRLAPPADPLEPVRALELTAEPRFARFAHELERLDAHVLARMLPRLAEELPADQARTVAERLFPHVTSADALAETARTLYLATGDAALSYRLLDSRAGELRLAAPAVAEALVELAAAGGAGSDADHDAGDLADRAEHWILNLLALGRVDETRAALTKARHALPRAARDRLHHRVADRLAARKRFDEAASVLVELADAACLTGDLDVATEAVVRARSIWALSEGCVTDSPRNPPEWLLERMERVERAWSDCTDLVEWKRTDEGRRREQLRERYLNQRIVIAGGFTHPEWEEKLRDLTGAEIEWAEKYRDEGDDLASTAAAIRSGRYAAVVYRWQKAGHMVGEKLKRACEGAGVAFLYARSAGMRGVIETLDRRDAVEAACI